MGTTIDEVRSVARCAAVLLALGVGCGESQPLDVARTGSVGGASSTSGSVASGSTSTGGATTGGGIGTSGGAGGAAGVTDAGRGSYPIDGSTCGAIIEEHPIEPSLHVPECSPVSFATNPPSSGNHYPTWVVHKTYSVPMPRGYLVHNLEHAGTVLWYNCPSGCDAEIAAAQQFIDQLPIDPLCPETGPSRRVLMSPDPLLDVSWAASTWGWTLRATCFERSSFERFVIEHYGQGPENFCSDGADFEDADGGALRLPLGCGAPPGDAAAN